jgi:KamA family protein
LTVDLIFDSKRRLVVAPGLPRILTLDFDLDASTEVDAGANTVKVSPVLFVDMDLQRPHVRRVRIHTRLPVVLPERIDRAFLETWSAVPLQKVVVVHANHAQEIDGKVRGAIAGLRAADTTVLNQTVLLRGINDRVAALVELSEALFEAGALPYYLHLLDRVAGAAHFDTPAATAQRLVAEVAAHLPGYLVPRLVREEPGAPAKTVLPPASR